MGGEPASPGPAVVIAGDLVIDEGTGQASMGGAPLHLTATEFKLLSALVRSRSRVMSKDQLLNKVWSYGRTQEFGPEDLGADRLAHGYAVTTHRSQGLTVEGTFELEDGGGRELSYVRLSRARGKTMAYTVADDIEMAAEDLRRSWSRETRQRWAIDRQPSDPRTPGFGLGQPATAPAAVRLARLGAEHQALSALIPPKPEADWQIQGDLNRLRNAVSDLDADYPYGPWKATPRRRGHASLEAVRQERHDAERHSHEAPWLRRPGFARAAREAAEREAPLEAAYRALAEPERARLAPQLAEAEERAAAHESAELANRRFLRIDHPEVPRRLAWIEREMDSLGDELFDTRIGLENAMGQGWEHADPTWADRGWSTERPGVEAEGFIGMLRDRATEQAAMDPDFGPDLGL